jgi:integrase
LEQGISGTLGKHAAHFTSARDSRNRKIPGILIRGNRFYASLWADRGDGTGRKTARKFPLMGEDGEPVKDITAAKEALLRLKNAALQSNLPAPGRKPGFSTWVDRYLLKPSFLKKKPGTRKGEALTLEHWKQHLGDTLLDRITTAQISAYLEKRLAKVSERTACLDMIILRNSLKAALDDGHMNALPRFPRIKSPPPARRHLLTPSDFEKLLECCLAVNSDGVPITKNGEQLRDYLRFLAFTGAREQEALGVRWSHVDFEGERVFIGAPEDFEAGRASIGTGGTSKNRGSRSVDFNDQLSRLLLELKARRAPDCSFLFPSPQRGNKDVPARSLRASFELAREAAGLPAMGFHDLRHVFASFCVMAGIDFMTIAAWLGHKDGGILVGKTYGHLLGEHRKKMAAKLTIGLAAPPDHPKPKKTKSAKKNHTSKP